MGIRKSSFDAVTIRLSCLSFSTSGTPSVAFNALVNCHRSSRDFTFVISSGREIRNVPKVYFILHLRAQAETSNAALERLPPATTNKSHSPASPLQALVMRGDSLKVDAGREIHAILTPILFPFQPLDAKPLHNFRYIRQTANLFPL